MLKILLVDDEFSVLRTLKNELERQKWYISVAESYEKAKEKILSETFDVIVCDYDLSSEKHGLQLIREIRGEDISTPVIFLTGQDPRQITPWDALNSGVDDFVLKPWKPKELVARIKAVARRSFACEKNSTNVLQHGDISLDLDLRRVFLGKKEVPLANILFLLLKKFLQNPHKLIHYKDFIKYIWGDSHGREIDRKNTLRVHIVHLKKVLGKERARLIHTVHGEGYVFEPQVG